MYKRQPQIWCSDDTDAVERLEIQEGTALIYPLSTMGAHVSAVSYTHLAKKDKEVERYFERYLNDLDTFFMLLQTHFGTKLTERNSCLLYTSRCV